MHDIAAPRWLLAAGLAAGLLAALVGLRQPAAAPLPPEAAARVNDRIITRDEWQRAVLAVASERRVELDDADRRRILERLVDEELLVQHGLALGLAAHDDRLRGLLVSEAMQVAARRGAVEPDEVTLRRFYDDHLEFFQPAPRLRVAAWRVGADGVRTALQPAVPDAPLPPAKLATYVGPELAAQAREMPLGIASAPVDGIVVEVRERTAAPAPPFEQVAEQVRAEARRRADEEAVRVLLEELRAAGRVTVATP